MAKGNFRQRAKTYKQGLRTGYNKGYRTGWTVYEEIPNTRGARVAAKYGFSKGMSRHKKSDKYIARAKETHE